MFSIEEVTKEAENGMKLLKMGVITRNELEDIYNKIRNDLGLPKLDEIKIVDVFSHLPPDSAPIQERRIIH